MSCSEVWNHRNCRDRTAQMFLVERVESLLKEDAHAAKWKAIHWPSLLGSQIPNAIWPHTIRHTACHTVYDALIERSVPGIVPASGPHVRINCDLDR